MLGCNFKITMNKFVGILRKSSALHNRV